MSLSKEKGVSRMSLSYGKGLSPHPGVSSPVSILASGASAGASVSGVDIPNLHLGADTNSSIFLNALHDDTTRGLMSFWFRRVSAGTNDVFIDDSADRVRIIFTDTAVNGALRINSGTNYFGTGSGSEIKASAYDDGNPHHFLMSWETTTSLMQIYIDGSSTGVAANAGVSAAIDTSRGSTTLGSDTGHTVSVDLDMAEFYFAAPASAYDLSTSANVMAFRTSGGNPVDIGVSGTGPLSVTPTYYINTSAGNIANRGDQVGAGTDFSAANPTNGSTNFGTYG